MSATSMIDFPLFRRVVIKKKKKKGLREGEAAAEHNVFLLLGQFWVNFFFSRRNSSVCLMVNWCDPLLGWGGVVVVVVQGLQLL